MAVVIFAAAHAAQAASLYWDGNGASAGAGTSPTGTWGTSNFWSTNSTGTATTQGDILTFSAGTDATGAYTLTVNGIQADRQLNLAYGTINFNGGTINLGSASNSSATATAANVTDTTGAFNYDVAAQGALDAGASVNTLRYTGNTGTTMLRDASIPHRQILSAELTFAHVIAGPSRQSPNPQSTRPKVFAQLPIPS